MGGWAAAAQVGGEIAGNLLGAHLTYKQNKKMLKLANRLSVDNFQHRYQWTMDDMRAAGLNPILAYQQGGGSAPSVGSQSIDFQGTGRAIGTAVGTSARKYLELRQARENIDNTKAQTDVLRREEDIKRQEGHLLRARRGVLDTRSMEPFKDLELESKINNQNASAESLRESLREVQARIDSLNAQARKSDAETGAIADYKTRRAFENDPRLLAIDKFLQTMSSAKSLAR